MPAFEMTRSIQINADAARVHALIDDFRQWQTWSPWEGLDPDLQRTYSGAESGVGAHYAWSGNKKAGEGTMEIVESDASRIAIRLNFIKPFKAENLSVFELKAAAGGTDVDWTMTGQRNLFMSVAGKLFFDAAIGKDFDRGLAAMRDAAEQA